MKIKEVVKPGKLFINGKFVNALSGKTFETINPATTEPLTTVAEGDAADIDLAVKAARKAFDEGPWPRMNARERGKIVSRIGDLIAEHAEEFALLDSLDNGKPLNETRNVDVPLSVEVFHYYGGWADKIVGETIPVNGPFLNYTLREPVGVVGQIIPWNFPLLMAGWKLAPALACGNTVVLKPAEQTPLSALRLAELCLEAGLPEGVLNVVPGFGPTAGAALAGHREVDKVAFTGEYLTGQEVMKAAAKNLKRISLELGGKSPNIVFDDVDLDAAVKGAMRGIFFNQGEVCCAGSRLFLSEKIYDEFVGKLVDEAKRLKVGDPLDPSTQMGAQVSQDQLNRITGYIEKGKKSGARLECGGERAEVPGLKGYFVKPTVFSGVKNEMTIAQEEIFGPVVAALPFEDLDDLAKRANDSIFGLAAAVWTSDIKKAHSLARKLRAGTIWINCYNMFDAASPFGGFKMSGFGRELGAHALELYTEVKSVWVAL
ncbi:MAG: aldehyde dehydrogenase family protein [Deltaproteobacteria bacterium]|nr:aldehyde dehydrogenase family protein [Deltaproteobacteria bacterium]